MPKEKLTHKQQLAERRTKSAMLLEQRKKEDKRRKIALWAAISVGIIIVVGLFTFILLNGSQKAEASQDSPAALSTNGVIMTSKTEVAKGTPYNLESGKPAKSETLMKDSAVPNVEIFLDYDCPHCKEFEDSSASYLDSLLEEGKATVEYKPIVVIGSNLSISGGNAAACVAEYAPARFNDAHNALFSKTGEQSVSVTKTIKDLKIEGETGKQVEECVSTKHFSKWLTKASEHALTLKDAKGEQLVTGTPTILVDGVKYPFDPSQFRTFMEVVLAGNTPEEVISQQQNVAKTP